MWSIINGIKRKGTMNTYEVSRYSIIILHRKKVCRRLYSQKSTVRSHFYWGTTYVNGKLENIYA